MTRSDADKAPAAKGVVVQSARDSPVATAAANSVLEDKIVFLEELCVTALRCGTTCLRLERYLSRVAGALGLQGDFLLTLRRSIVLVGAEGTERQVRVVRTGDASFDMERLGSVEGVARRVERGQLTAAEGTAALAELAKKPPRYGTGWTALCWAATASAFAVLLSATWLDAAVAGLLSVVAFVVTSWASRWRVLREVTSLGAAIVVILRVPLRYAGWTIVGGLVVWLGVTIGAEMGFWQGSFLGALLLGLYSSGFARHTAQPASTVTLSCVMILVPGAAVLMGLHTVRTAGSAAGLTSEWHAFLNALAIVVGFVVANALVPQDGEL